MGEHARTQRRQALASMSRQRLIRFAAVLVGAAVLFWLEQGFGAKLYVAIPAGILAYVATLVALGFALGKGAGAK
jgi:uncharacterized membrane protein